MAYEGEGTGERRSEDVYEGTSEECLDNAIRAAVHASGVKHGTRLVISQIEVVTKGDPNIGSYKVIVRPPGP